MQAGYFSTAWSDIKHSPNWFGKMCLLALVGMIPIFGQMVLAGYAYGWARDIAWNIHAPMPAKIFGNEDGRLYSRGFFALVISLVFSLAALILYGLYAGVAYSGSGVASLLLQLLQLAASIVGGVFALVGCMRMSIYGRLSPGFQIKQIWKMVRHDTNGLARIVGMVVLVGFIISIVLGIVFFVVFMLVFLVGGASVAGRISSGANLEYLASDPSFWAALAPSMGLFVILSLVLGFFAMVAGVFVEILSARAGGYWTRQFNVAEWGGQDDPLPFETRAQAAYPGQAPVQGQYGGYAQPDQPQQASSAQPQANAYQVGNPAAYPTTGASAYPANQAPDWVVQAKASAPAPQTDPYAAAAQAGQGAYVNPVQVASSPQQTSATVPVSQPSPQVESAYPASTFAPASAQPVNVGQASVPNQASQAFQPAASQPAAMQPFSHQPAVSQPFDAPQAQATASAAQPVASDAFSDEPAVPASRDMHHRHQAKPAPRWEKIDLDALNNEDGGSVAH